MRDLTGKIAVVTGAASGIGLAIARALGRAGMQVALLDIQPDAAKRAGESLAEAGIRCIPVAVDVSDPSSVQRAADEIVHRLGKPHLLANNAGVAFHGTPLSETSHADWQWVLGVNLMGAIHAVDAFLPLLREQAEAHIVNTASGSGFFIRPGRHQGPYAASKYALVAYTEALEAELAGSSVHVSLLCPGATSTQIHASGQNRPARFGGAVERPQELYLKDIAGQGLDPDTVAETALHGIRENRFYIFTHPGTRDLIEARHARILEAFS